MKSAIEEIIERLEVEKEKATRRYSLDSEFSYAKAIKIVKEVAEEYGEDTNVHTNGWIPVDKELPTTSRKCWVTLDINGKLITRRDCFHHGEWEISMNKYVIAWQYEEKPKPYKSKGE